MGASSSRPGVLVIWLIVCAQMTPALAQQRPLTVEDPETIGDGRVLVEAGIETGENVLQPVSGLRGDRRALPLGVSVGLGGIAELQIDGGYQWLSIDSRVEAPLAPRVPPDLTETSDLVDLTLATKIRVVSEGARRPAFGVRFATRLPNASNERGLGTDTLDFFATVLVAKTGGSVRVVGNAGVGLLTSPLAGSLQQDVLVGGLSVARAVTDHFEVVGEFAGRHAAFADEPPVGAESRGALRAAARYTRGSWRVDAGLIVGVTDQDPDIGLTAGLTWVVDAFRAP